MPRIGGFAGFYFGKNGFYITLSDQWRLPEIPVIFVGTFRFHVFHGRVTVSACQVLHLSSQDGPDPSAAGRKRC